MGAKRNASRSMGAAHKRLATGVTGKCKTIASVVRHAEDVPQPVRAMLCDTLVRTFTAYKEERHPIQNSVAATVGNVLKRAQAKLQATINDAQQKKATLEAEAAPSIATKEAAHAASEAAAHALADGKTALANGKTALKDAKTAVHDLEAAAKAGASEAAASKAKKDEFEALLHDYILAVKEGNKHGASTGRHVAKEMGSHLEPEFASHVAHTFSKAGTTWGTFDNIIDTRLGEILQKILAGLSSELAAFASDAEARASSIEAAKGAVVAAEEAVKGMEEACTIAYTSSKDAEAAAKEAAAAVKHQEHHIHKAADVCAHAEEALATFTNGPLAAYNEVEARSRPAPAPEVSSVEAAMEPAPAPAARAAPTILPSPGVLSWVGQMSGLAPSPKIAQTPAVASSPRR